MDAHGLHGLHGTHGTAAMAPAQQTPPALRWTRDMKTAFDVLGPAALVLVATDGPLSVDLLGAGGSVIRRIGHNRGVWPAKIARTKSWRDTVTAAYDKGPFCFVGAQFRVWCLDEVRRNRLADAVVDMIAARCEADGGVSELHNGFQDLGPSLDLAVFEVEIHDMAARMGISVLGDDDLVMFLARVASRVAADRARGGGLIDPVRAYDTAAAKESAAISARTGSGPRAA